MKGVVLVMIYFFMLYIFDEKELDSFLFLVDLFEYVALTEFAEFVEFAEFLMEEVYFLLFVFPLVQLRPVVQLTTWLAQ